MRAKLAIFSFAAFAEFLTVPSLVSAQVVTNLSSDHLYGPNAIDVTHGDAKYKVKTNYTFPKDTTGKENSINTSLVNIFGSDVTSKTYSYVPDKSLGLKTTPIKSYYNPNLSQ
jgi:hypothetical protein